MDPVLEVFADSKQIDKEEMPNVDVIKSKILQEIQIAVERAKADGPVNYSKANHYQYGKN